MSIIMLLGMNFLPILFFIFWIIRSKRRLKKLTEEEKNILKEADKKVKKFKDFLFGLLAIFIIISIVMCINLIISEFSSSCNSSGLISKAVLARDIEDIFVEVNKIQSTARIANMVINCIDLIYFILIIEYIVFFVYIKKCKKLNDEEKRILKYVYGGNIFSLISSLVWAHIVGQILSIPFQVAYKPVIYLYPEKEEKVKIKFKDKEKLTCTYPKYYDEWNVVASTDGTLKDENGRKYYSLYWEGINNIKVDENIGFCVKGEDTISFLEEKLEKLGLNYKEAEEFIIYWLPQLEKNKYNYIYFKQTEEVNELMPMDVTPTPDSIIRILMVFKPLNNKINVKDQEIITPKREGFTLVEWGGSRI